MCHLYTLTIIKYSSEKMHVIVDIIPGVREEDFLEELEETAAVSEGGESRKRKRVHEEQEETDEHSSSSKSTTSRASSTSKTSDTSSHISAKSQTSRTLADKRKRQCRTQFYPIKDFASIFNLVFNCNQITCFLFNFTRWYFINRVFLDETASKTDKHLTIARNDYTKDEHTLIDDDEDDREPEVRPELVGDVTTVHEEDVRELIPYDAVIMVSKSSLIEFLVQAFVRQKHLVKKSKNYSKYDMYYTDRLIDCLKFKLK